MKSRVVVSSTGNYPKDSEVVQPTTLLPSDSTFFAPKYSIWFQLLTIPPCASYTFTDFEHCMNRCTDICIPWVTVNEIRQNILKGNLSEIKAPFIPYVTKDIADKKKVVFKTDIKLNSTVSVIEVIVGDKQIERHQISSNYKQNLAIFTNQVHYDYYPPLYLFDTNLVAIRFFDILS